MADADQTAARYAYGYHPYAHPYALRPPLLVARRRAGLQLRVSENGAGSGRRSGRGAFAAALGLAFNASRQRLRWASSGGMAIRADLAKSSATSPVMSATVNRSPAMNGRSRKRLVDDRHRMKRPWPIDRRPVGNLRIFHFRHFRMAVTQHLRNRQEEPQFELALPHLDRRLLERG